MTYLEQACHRHALTLWRQRTKLSTCRARIISKILRFSESSSRPTASASILVFSNVAAAGADVYRSRAPQISDWTRSLASRQGLPSMMILKAGAAIVALTGAGALGAMAQDVTPPGTGRSSP